MDGLIADSRGGKTTSKDGRAYRWTVEVGRQHPRMHGLIADSRGGKTTSKDGRAYRWQ